MTAGAAYNEAFYNAISTGSARSASVIVPIILDAYPDIKSVIDIGCGNGSFLRSFASSGIEDFLGIDGEWASHTLDTVTQTRFVACDLRSDWPSLDRRFDLAVCLEVAEHLPTERSVGLVRLCTAASDLVVFSAAIPFQGGVDHVNEQWQSHWISLFRSEGYGVQDSIRPKIWESILVEPWYCQNLLIFGKGTDDSIIYTDIVHPRLFEFYRQQAPGRIGPRLFRLLLRTAHRALREMMSLIRIR